MESRAGPASIKTRIFRPPGMGQQFPHSPIPLEIPPRRMAASGPDYRPRAVRSLRRLAGGVAGREEAGAALRTARRKNRSERASVQAHTLVQKTAAFGSCQAPRLFLAELWGTAASCLALGTARAVHKCGQHQSKETREQCY